MHFANVSVQSNYPPLSVFRIINVLLTFYCSSTAGMAAAAPAGSALSSVFAGKKDSEGKEQMALIQSFFCRIRIV